MPAPVSNPILIRIRGLVPHRYLTPFLTFLIWRIRKGVRYIGMYQTPNQENVRSSLGKSINVYKRMVEKIIDFGKERKKRKGQEESLPEGEPSTKSPENLFDCLPISVGRALFAIHRENLKNQREGGVSVSDKQRKLAESKISALSDDAVYEYLLQLEGVDLRSPFSRSQLRWYPAFFEALFIRAMQSPPRK